MGGIWFVADDKIVHQFGNLQNVRGLVAHRLAPVYRDRCSASPSLNVTVMRNGNSKEGIVNK
jgi:hypothetical protein